MSFPYRLEANRINTTEHNYSRTDGLIHQLSKHLDPFTSEAKDHGFMNLEYFGLGGLRLRSGHPTQNIRFY
jgi:hypothetical protein